MTTLTQQGGLILSNPDIWRELNNDGTDIGLYCQNCCYRYPDECIFIDTIHPYDRAAENCPDFVPKDMYKGVARANCWKLRLNFDPDYKPLPDSMLWHPIYFGVVCST